MANKLVVIDSDFFNHLSKRDPNGEMICRIFEELGYTPVFHTFVYHDELKDHNPVAEKLVAENKIKVIAYEDFLQTGVDRMLYDMQFRKLFQSLNGGRPFEDATHAANCFEFHGHMLNAGEIHSALMAQSMNIVYMCSDDSKARATLQTYVRTEAYQLSIMQYSDFFLQYAALPDKHIKMGEFKKWMKHIFESRGQMGKYQRIRALWENTIET